MSYYGNGNGCFNPCGPPPYPIYPPVPVPFADEFRRERVVQGPPGPPGPQGQPGRDAVSPATVGTSATIPAQTIPALAVAAPLMINTPYYTSGSISIAPSTGVITFGVTGRYMLTLQIQLTSGVATGDIILGAITSGTILGVPATIDSVTISNPGDPNNFLVANLIITITVPNSTLQFTINNSANATPVSILVGQLGIQRIAIV